MSITDYTTNRWLSSQLCNITQNLSRLPSAKNSGLGRPGDTREPGTTARAAIDGDRAEITVSTLTCADLPGGG
jgi:hypothetical protein